MGDGIGLWARRAGRSLLTGAFMMGVSVVRTGWFPMRVLGFLAGVAMMVDCGIETWKLLRSEEPTRAAPDRTEAAGRAEDD
ncbi:hypothetical protein [Streptomyces sp. NPDC003522]